MRSWQTKPLKNKPKTLHVPFRKCTGCGLKRPQNELLRLGKLADGSFVVNEAPYNGRGAYFCKSEKCINKGFVASRVAHTLRIVKSPVDLRSQQENVLKKLKELST